MSLPTRSSFARIAPKMEWKIKQSAHISHLRSNFIWQPASGPDRIVLGRQRNMHWIVISLDNADSCNIDVQVKIHVTGKLFPSPSFLLALVYSFHTTLVHQRFCPYYGFNFLHWAFKSLYAFCATFKQPSIYSINYNPARFTKAAKTLLLCSTYRRQDFAE